jgi:hypothetical protein
MAMFLNGVPTGMERILQQFKPTLQALQQVRPALFVVAAGTSMPRLAVQPFATHTIHTATTSLADFVWLLHPSSFLVESWKYEKLKVERESKAFNFWQNRWNKLANSIQPLQLFKFKFRLF